MKELDWFLVCIFLLMSHVGFFIAGFSFCRKISKSGGK